MNNQDSKEPVEESKSVAVYTTLIAVVSELTGYPEDMLDPVLSIEADLGIDNIKLMQILGSIGERIPGLPQLTPDMIGHLKTLGDIVRFIIKVSGDSTLEMTHRCTSTSSEVSESSIPPPSREVLDTDLSKEYQVEMKVYNFICKEISQICNCPIDVIESSMLLLDDLGLDSLHLGKLILDFEDQFGVKVPMDEFYKNVKTGDLKEFVEILSKYWIRK